MENLDVRFEDATKEFEYFEIKRGDMTEELGERLDMARAEMTKMTHKQDVMIEKMDSNTSILKENTSILNDFKNETNENLGRLTNIMTKHDVDAQERIANLTEAPVQPPLIKTEKPINVNNELERTGTNSYLSLFKNKISGANMFPELTISHPLMFPNPSSLQNAVLQ